MSLGSVFLPAFRKNALAANTRLLPRILEGEAGAAEVQDFCRNYRVAAICSLLLAASAEDFHRFLRKSAAAFAFYSARKSPAFTLPRALAPAMDALACGDFEAAATIFQQVGDTWDPGTEYEEDFLYARFLGAHFFGAPDPARDAGWVDRYAELVGTRDDARLSVLRAFLAGDAERFEQGLEQLLSERARRYQRLAAKQAIPLWESSTEGYISIEGLALLALAERKGLHTRTDYLHVPALVRLPATRTGTRADWRQPLD
ncbi:immunity 49 family protein [Corallococcus sp. ZKHCc1 1396]|uniref:Immunity 49 family protein n=1 Tax=Corallococcus soli TaxID=2710757 RepID=A0ABR9PYA7_9BACT|nr:Imm49 family immunity protein [Corallococcus soli]MBE4752844.1 immunity 49 family protein [Corallococcus soli]